MQSDLKTLRYFAVLAETLSFTAAAVKLRMSQPALSIAVQRMEEQLGIVLINRTSRSVVLTPAGETYARGAREVIALLEQVERTVAEVAAGKDGVCRLGFVQSASFDVLPQVLRALQHDLPGIRLHLSELTSTEQLAKLVEGQIDLGMIRQAIFPPEILKLELVHRQRMVAAVPAAHRLANQSSVPLSSLEAERFITTPDRRSPALNARVRAACAAAGFQPMTGLEVVEMATILSFVGEGLGVALVPSCCRRFADRSTVLLDIEDSTEHLDLPLYLAYRVNEKDAAVKRVHQVAKTVFESIGLADPSS